MFFWNSEEIADWNALQDVFEGVEERYPGYSSDLDNVSSFWGFDEGLAQEMRDKQRRYESQKTLQQEGRSLAKEAQKTQKQQLKDYQSDRTYQKQRMERLDRLAEQRHKEAQARLDRAEARERERQRVVDSSKRDSLKLLSGIQNRRQELIEDVKNAPSSVMQAGRMAQETQLKNMAAVASLTGGKNTFGRTAEDAFSDSTKTADANLLNNLGLGLLQEKQQRQGVEASLLGQQEAGAMKKAAIAAGEGNQLGPYLAGEGSAFGGQLNLGQLGLGSLATGLSGLGQLGQISLRERQFGQTQQQINLQRRKQDFYEDNYLFNSLLGASVGLGGAAIQAFAGD